MLNQSEGYRSRHKAAWDRSDNEPWRLEQGRLGRTRTWPYNGSVEKWVPSGPDATNLKLIRGGAAWERIAERIILARKLGWVLTAESLYPNDIEVTDSLIDEVALWLDSGLADHVIERVKNDMPERTRLFTKHEDRAAAARMGGRREKPEEPRKREPPRERSESRRIRRDKERKERDEHERETRKRRSSSRK